MAELGALADEGAFNRLDKAAPTEAGPPAPVWVQRFSSTERGARLARHLLLRHLESRGLPHGGAVSDRVGLVVAELAANAVRHGRLPGRDFEVRVTELDQAFRVEVSDARSETKPVVRTVGGEAGGFGLRLVDALSAAWGVSERSPGKTVWAEILKSGAA
ncbi:ATP-binding protein [Streptomyces sp. NPDC059708]|uniref:ATP-binding protein n=1 Tax=Streptomyces sp. NPDC059708 TaxID=3346916 RepID=UPI0036AB099D